MNDNTLNPRLILSPIRQAAPANGGTHICYEVCSTDSTMGWNVEVRGGM